MHIPTVREHLVELATNLGGYFICLDIHFSNLDLINDQVFDILIVHYSVRFTVPHNPDFINKIKRFAGKKLLFIQDDYDNTLFALKQIKQCNFDMIATSAPQHILNLIYPKKHFPFTHVASVLSGYVSQEMQMRKRFWTNLDLRAFYFVYRGRELPPRYGKLGADKSLIGKLFSDRLKNSNIFFDISSSANDRVYESWLNFLSKGKSTLITESGSSIIDWNGDLLALDDLGSGFQSSKTLSSKELENPWNCISPKAFEAISVGTILVGFQGHYSGVLKEGVHFLRIERDLSNLDEIINLLQDGIVAEQFRDRVFFDIILNTKYTYIALAQTIKELFFEIGHRQQALNQRCITPIEFYQDASSNWNMKIEKGDLSKRLRIRGANPNFIPFYVIEKRQLFSDYLSALNSLKSWKKVRFSLFKFALNKSFSRKIFFFFGRKSSKMNRYLHVIR
jgi:hypothetical protein